MRQLRVRAGFPPALSLFTDSFVFRAAEPNGMAPEWKNVEQLEAVVEFYVNHRVPAVAAQRIGDPWATGANPLDPSHANYERVNLGLLQGTRAKVKPGGAGNVVILDDDADLGDVIVNPKPAGNPVIPAIAAAGPNLPQPRKFLFDTLELKGETRRPTKLFRIMKVDNVTKEVELDEPPTLSGSSSDWKLHRRPIIVVIDPLGPRRINATANPFAATVWEGSSATVEPGDPNHPSWTVLKLNPPAGGAAAPPLDRVNPGVDTIFLKEDSASTINPRPARTYRIMKVYPGANRTIAVEGKPTLPAAGSSWQIPAGLSGELPRLEYNLNPGPGALWDHYDALLLVVYDGVVHQAYRFSTYTSRRQAGQNLSSVRGNRRYAYASFRSGGNGAQFRNFNCKIVDAASSPTGLTDTHVADTVAEARYYFDMAVPPGGVDPLPNVTRDANGKGTIRFHRGNRIAAGSGSAGCSVSPDFVLMRTLLVKLYEAHFRAFYGVTQANVDPEVHKLNPSVGVAAEQNLDDGTVDRAHVDVTRAVTGADAQNTDSEQLFAGAIKGGLSNANWDNKLRGNVWLIRPDEPPLS